MEDEKLLRISLVTACIGLFALFLILQLSAERVYSVEEVKELSDNEDVVVYGVIDGLRETEKVVMFDVIEYRIIKQKALFFKEDNSNLDVKKGDRIKIKGSMYNGNIVIDKVEKYG